MSDFGADTSDFHSVYASDFRTESNDFASDFPGDFPGDFGGAPRTEKQHRRRPPRPPRRSRGQPPTNPQGNMDCGKLAAHRTRGNTRSRGKCHAIGS